MVLVVGVAGVLKGGLRSRQSLKEFWEAWMKRWRGRCWLRTRVKTCAFAGVDAEDR